MAWTYTGNRGTGTSTVSGTTVTATPSSNYATDSIAVVFVTSDQTGTTSGTGTTNEIRVSDNSGSGQRWVKLGEVLRTSGVAADGDVIAAFFCDVISLTTGHTVTVTLGTARTAKAVDLEEFAIGVNKVPFVASGNGATGTGTTPTVTSAPGTAPVTSRLWLGIAGREGANSETFTQDGTFSDLGASGKFGTAALGTTSDISAGVGYKISTTDTTETYNPTFGTADDWATALWAVDEADPSRYDTLILGADYAPRAYWPLGEWAGDFAIDYAGQNPGLYTSNGGSHTYNTTANLVGDIAARGAHLFTRGSSTTGPYVLVPDANDLDLTNGPISIMGWATLTVTPSTDKDWTILDKNTGAYNLSYESLTGGGHDNMFRFAKSQTATMDYGPTTADLLTHFVVATKTGSTHKLYQDGRDVGSAGADQTLVDTANTLLIGTQTSATTFQTWRGQSIAIIPAALTADQQGVLYRMGSGASLQTGVPVRVASRFTGPPVLRYRFQYPVPAGTQGPIAYNQALTGTLSFVGAQSKLTGRPLAGTLSFIGALAKRTSRALTGTLSFIGAHTKTAGKALTGTLSFVGAHSKRVGKALTATLSFVGNITRFISRPLTATLSFVGSTAKRTSRAFTATLSFVGSLSPSHLFTLALTATLSFAGSLTKRTGKSLTGTLSFVGAHVKTTARALTGTLSFVGAIAKRTNRAFTATLSFVGALSPSHLFTLALSATLSFAGALSKRTTRGLTGTLSFVGAMSKTAGKALTATLSFSGSMTKRTGKALVATLSFVGSVAKRTARAFTATLSFVGSLARQLILGGPGSVAGPAPHGSSSASGPSGISRLLSGLGFGGSSSSQGGSRGSGSSGSSGSADSKGSGTDV